MLWTYFFEVLNLPLNFPQRQRRPPGMLLRFTCHHNWSSLFLFLLFIAIIIILFDISEMGPGFFVIIRISENANKTQIHEF